MLDLSFPALAIVQCCAPILVRLHVYFGSQALDLIVEYLVFPQFETQKLSRYTSFFVHAGWREYIQVTGFLSATAKILCLDQPLVDERLQAKVRLSEAYADLFGKLTLRRLGVIFKEGEQSIP